MHSSGLMTSLLHHPYAFPPITVGQVEYSERFAEANPQAQSLRHLLSEAHLLLRASLLQTPEQQRSSESEAAVLAENNNTALMERREVEEAFRKNSAQLGDCFSR